MIDIRRIKKYPTRFPHQMLENTLPTNGTMFRKLEPKKPAVVRIGNDVKTCHFYNGMKECLGVRCYWPRVGKCNIFDKIIAKANAPGKKKKTLKNTKKKTKAKKVKKTKTRKIVRKTKSRKTRKK